MRIILILFLICFICSCSNPNNSTTKNENNTETEIASPEAAEVKREAVFTYGGKEDLSEKVILKFSSSPAPIKDGYVRLAGIVWCNNPIACLEISGKGVLVGAGEEIDQYIVSSITKGEVELCLKR